MSDAGPPKPGAPPGSPLAGLLHSRLVRASLRAAWLAAAASAPTLLPGLDDAGGGELYRLLFGMLTAVSLLLARPVFAFAVLVVLQFHLLLSAWGNPPPPWMPLATLGLLALLFAVRGALAEPRALALEGLAQRALRGFLLMASVTALVPMYWDWGSPYITLYLSPVYFLLWTQMPHRLPLHSELTRSMAGGAVFVLVLVLALELQSRLLFRDNPPNAALVAHPERVVTLRPDSVYTYSNPELGAPPFRAEISRDGVRGPALAPKPEGRFRVLCLGDSHTFGWGVRDEECYPRLLEQELRARFDEDAADVVNAGTPTYGPWQSLDWLLEHGERFAPDFVVYQFFPVNDVANEMYVYGEFPRCYDERSARRYQSYERMEQWPERVDFWLRDHSRCYQTWTLLNPDADAPAVALAYGLRAWKGDAPDELPVTDLGEPGLELHRAEWYPELEQGFARAMESVDAIRAYCDARGLGFAAFALPSIASVDRRVFEHGQRESHWACAPFEEAKPERHSEAEFVARGMPHINVLDPLRAAFEPVTDEPLYIPHDGHLGPPGNAVVARTVADYLTPLIEARAPAAP